MPYMSVFERWSDTGFCFLFRHCIYQLYHVFWGRHHVALAGALKKAAENARKDGKSVGCSIVETFGKNAAPQELSDVLRLEYRSKLLNPKWAKVSDTAVLTFGNNLYLLFAVVIAAAAYLFSLCSM